MRPLPAVEFHKMYLLIQQSGSSMYFMTTGSSIGQTSYGTGFYNNREDAEKARTLAVLSDKGDPPHQYHIFELEFPNPVFKSG